MKSWKILILLCILGFVSWSKTLEFALAGDDWLALYRYIVTYPNFFDHFKLINFTNNYDIANIIMGVIWNFFRLNPLPYYLISLLLKIIAGLSWYPAITAMTKSRLAGVLSSVFFVGIAAGAESTGWVFNMNTYLAVGVFNLFLYNFYTKVNTNIGKTDLINSILLIASFFIAPTRMHGMLMMVPVLVLLDKHGNKVSLLAIYLLPLAVIKHFVSPANEIGKIISGIKNPTVIEGMLANSGKIFISDYLVKLSDKNWLLVGLIGLILIVVFLARTKSQRLKISGMVAVIAAGFFLIIPEIINNGAVFVSEHRYLLIPASWISTAIAIVMADLFYKKSKLVFVGLLACWMGINYVGLQTNINYWANNGRTQAEVKRYFETIDKNITPDGKLKIVLFEGEDRPTIYHALSFGFSLHMMVRNPRYGTDPQFAPLAVDSYESLLKVLTEESGTELYRYGYKKQQVAIDDVYLFRLTNHNLEDRSTELRNDITGLVKK